MGGAVRQSTPDELLFSYGALRRAALQRDLFGRAVRGEADILPGYTTDYIEASDPRWQDRVGTSPRPILRRTGDARDKVIGLALHVTADEL
ncbi:MAG: gamma-glutamylcyclotransferase, partial [Microbacterium sp.]